MINAEVEPLGGFIAEAFALPAFQGGTLLTVLVFMFAQDPIMGLAAIVLYPFQIYVIPKLQRQVNLLGKARVRQVRRLADRIARNRRRGARHPGQRHHAIRARALHPRTRRRLQHPLPDLQEEVLHQVPQQFHGAARPVLLLFDRRLSGDHGRPHAGRAGGGGRRAQGALFAVEGAAQPLPAHLGLADQVRAGGRPVRPRRAARRGAAERGPDRGGAAHGPAARHQSDAHLGGRSAAAGWRQLRRRAARAHRASWARPAAARRS